MNFQDPFAGDLDGIRRRSNAPAASSRAAAPSAQQGPSFWGTPQSFTFGTSRGETRDNAAVNPPAAVNVGAALGRLGGTTAAPTPAPLTTAAATTGGAPVAGRRAAAAPGPSAASPSLTSAPTASTGPLDWLDTSPTRVQPAAAAQPQPWGQGGLAPQRATMVTAAPTPRAQAAVDDNDPLSFLDPDAGRHARVAAQAPMMTTAADPPAGGLATGEDDLVARAQTARLEAAERARAAKAAKEAELRDLYASLDAVDMELSQLQDKLDTQAIREEAELTNLETTVLIKRQELTVQQSQVEAKVAEAQQYGERQVKDMQARFAAERESMQRDVRASEGGRQQRQLRELLEALKAQQEKLQLLRRERDLVMHTKPFEPEGIRIAVAMSAAEDADAAAHHDQPVESAEAHEGEQPRPSTPLATPADVVRETTPAAAPASGADAFDDFFNEFPDLAPAADSAGETAAAAGDQSRRTSSAAAVATPAVTSRPSGNPAEVHGQVAEAQRRVLRDPSVEEALGAAVQLLQRYLATHLTAVKEQVVDCVHTETSLVAHETRKAKMEEWAGEASHRQQRLAEHTLASMEAARARRAERDAHESARLEQLHAILSQGREAVRAQSKKRLEALHTELTARLAYTTKAFSTEAEQTWKVIEKELRAVLDGDSAMAAAQRSELTHRLGVDRRVRHQLFAAQRDTLTDQLTQLKRKSQENYETRLQELMESIGTMSGRCTVNEVRAHLQDMCNLVVQQRERLRQDSQRRADGCAALSDEARDTGTMSDTATSDHYMHLHELRHQFHTLQTLAQEAFAKTHTMYQEAAHARGQLMTRLKDGLVASWQARRSAQQSHNTQIEFTRRLWEREHRQCLQASHTLSLLLDQPHNASNESSGSTTSATAIAETRVYPQDVSLTLLLEGLCDKLGQCLKQSSEQRTQRRSLQAEANERAASVHAQHGEVQLLWAALYEQLLRIHDEQKSLSAQTTAVAEESVRLTGEQQRIENETQDVERRLNACRLEGAEARETYARTLEHYVKLKRRLDKLADEQLALAQEQNLLQLQGGRTTVVMRAPTASFTRGTTKQVGTTTPYRSECNTSGDCEEEEEGGLSPEQPQQRQSHSAQPAPSSRGAAVDSTAPSSGSTSHASAEVSPIMMRQSPLRRQRPPHRGGEVDEVAVNEIHPPVSPRRSRTATPSNQRDAAQRASATAAAAGHPTSTDVHRTPPRSFPRTTGADVSSPVMAVASTSGGAASQETSGVSATSLYRTSFMDLLSVMDSTTTSF